MIRVSDDLAATATRTLQAHGPHDVARELALLAAEAGAQTVSDVYGEGALIRDFEAEVAALLGKPAAVFMPSGTMAQQIALRIWAERHQTRAVAFHATSHLELHEQHGYTHLHGLEATLIGDPSRPWSLDDLRSVPATPRLAAVLWELPQRELGGVLPPWDDLVAQIAWARARGAATHLDGARLWQCPPFYGRPVHEIAALFDSVYVSFYKDLGAIAGAVLAADAEVIEDARVWLRRHGGNLVRLYPYVLSARHGLRERRPRIPQWHVWMQDFAAAVRPIDGLTLTPDPPHTNMVHLRLRGDGPRLIAELGAVARETGVLLLRGLAEGATPLEWRAELNVCDAAAAVPPAEAAALFARVLRAGA